jgi:hypothetical protein
LYNDFLTAIGTHNFDDGFCLWNVSNPNWQSNCWFNVCRILFLFFWLIFFFLSSNFLFPFFFLFSFEGFWKSVQQLVQHSSPE